MRRAVALGGCVLAASISVLGIASVRAQGNEPQIAVSPSSHDFGKLCVGKTTAPQKFTISNNASGGGGNDLQVSSITNTGPDQDFTPANLSSATIPAGGTATFNVTFMAKARGSRNATLSVESNDPNSPSYPVGVSGTGIDRRLVPDRTTVSFGPQRVGTRSPSQDLLIRNTGGDTVTVTGVARRGSGARDFVVGFPATPFSIAPGAFKTVTVAFQPSVAGDRHAGIQFDSNACANPTLTVALVGSGADPNVVVTPNPVNAGASPKGIKGPAVPVTVANDGGAALKITVIQVVGPDADDFELSGLPVMPTSVPAGGSFVFNVFMTPSAEGARTATIKVASDDPDAPSLEVPLSGVGGTASPAPTSSPRRSTPTAGPTSTSTSPRALVGGPPNDSLAIGLVVGGVVAAFGGLMFLRRFVAKPDED
jgi:hypothetical protein